MKALLLAVITCTACAQSMTGPLASGSWGGTGVSLVVTDSSAHLEFDCASGDAPAPFNVADGKFSVGGTVNVGHGGPTREGEPPDVRPAVFSGKTDGSQMSLTVAVGGSTPFTNSYELKKNAAPLLHRCL